MNGKPVYGHGSDIRLRNCGMKTDSLAAMNQAVWNFQDRVSPVAAGVAIFVNFFVVSTVETGS
jgi:hypothetical protein